MPVTANIRMDTMTMLTEGALHRLFAWTSPGYPIGGFTYSHGLETAVEDGRVRTADDVADYVEAVLARGGGWVDAVLFAHAWRAAGDDAAFDTVAELAAAFRGSSETALESHQQGGSFLSITRAAWPHPALDAFASRNGDRPVAHAAIMALACAAHAVPLMPALHAFLHATAANLVSAGVRLVPLGQTAGQLALTRLTVALPAIADRALTTPLNDLGTASPLLELASIAHETLYTRLFRS
jgi:urease accessory protein